MFIFFNYYIRFVWFPHVHPHLFLSGWCSGFDQCDNLCCCFYCGLGFLEYRRPQSQGFRDPSSVSEMHRLCGILAAPFQMTL